MKAILSNPFSVDTITREISGSVFPLELKAVHGADTKVYTYRLVRTVKKGDPIEGLTFSDGSTAQRVFAKDDIGFYDQEI